MIETKFLRAFRAIVAELVAPFQQDCLVRYRVVQASVDRYELQVVSKGTGWPDLVPCPVRPGAAGYRADLVLGSTVLVAFIERDPQQPVIVAFEEVGKPGWIPTMIVIAQGGEMPAARQGDTIKCLLPPAVFTGTINGLPATGVITFPTGYTLGAILVGSAKVKIG